MIQHPKSKALDDAIFDMFNVIDDFLEETYGNLYPLHPNRAKRGDTSNKSMDGLFNVGATFSNGYGSIYGKGYVVEIYLSTLAGVDQSVRDNIEGDVLKMILDLLPKFFPGRELDCQKDGRVLKIFGDFSLGDI